MGKIILDGMLGKLSRWLRMLGVQTEYYSGVGDEELLRILQNNPGSILLTRDKTLHVILRRRGFSSILVPGGSEDDVLAWVLERLKVEPFFKPEKALCSICGSQLIRVEPSEVVGKVPERVLETYREFYLCKGCGQVYWLGTHITEIEKKLERVRWIIYGKVVC
ncbi:MAG: Mut7-C RNAse domain-containing protein [Infirmifilum sp.]